MKGEQGKKSLGTHAASCACSWVNSHTNPLQCMRSPHPITWLYSPAAPLSQHFSFQGALLVAPELSTSKQNAVLERSGLPPTWRVPWRFFRFFFPLNCTSQKASADRASHPIAANKSAMATLKWSVGASQAEKQHPGTVSFNVSIWTGPEGNQVVDEV